MTGKFVPVDVDVGIEVNGKSEIRNGLEAGQKVVVSGQFLIDSESSLKASTLRMEESPAMAAAEGSGMTHSGQGKVEQIGDREVTISHGPIASMQWGAMTMGFRIPGTGLPKNIAVGDTVTFAFQQAKGGQFELTSIAPLASAPAGGRAAQPTSKQKTPMATDGAMTSDPTGMKK